MESGWQNNEAPEKVYKYRVIDRDKNYTEDLVLRRHCFFSGADKFNDPFDFRVTFSSEGTLQQLKASALGQILEAKCTPTNEEWERLFENRHKLLQDSRPELDMHVRETGVFCVSANPISTLMWSHYAASHTGICLEFDTRYGGQENILNSKNLRCVEYSQITPVYRAFQDSDTDLVRSSIFRKSIDWRYEKEWRVIKSKGANTIETYPEGSLTAIILGLKTSHDDKNQVNKWRRELSKQPDLYRVKIQDGTYQLALEPA